MLIDLYQNTNTKSSTQKKPFLLCTFCKETITNYYGNLRNRIICITFAIVMRIVNLLGGLGNQMFQFALYRALQKRFPDERVLVDLHCFNGYKKHRGFEIDKVFDVTFEKASWREVARLAYPYPNFQSWRIGSRVLPVRHTMLKERADFTLEPTALTRTVDTYYDGYWQHEEYFNDIRDVILQTFRFPAFADEQNQQTAERLQTTNSIGIHVRRGDYTHDKLFHDICDLDYYRQAISRMQQATDGELFCIFSDDMAWCREHIAPLLAGKAIVYADWNRGERSIQDIHLMSLCRHNIIANSSFSWWGAWLNQNAEKVVVAPAKWIHISGAVSPVPNSWIRITT